MSGGGEFFTAEQTAALNATITHLNVLITSLYTKVAALRDAAQGHEARLVRLERIVASVAVAAAGVVDEEEEEDGTEEDINAFTLLPPSPPLPSASQTQTKKSRLSFSS